MKPIYLILIFLLSSVATANTETIITDTTICHYGDLFDSLVILQEEINQVHTQIARKVIKNEPGVQELPDSLLPSLLLSYGGITVLESKGAISSTVLSHKWTIDSLTLSLKSTLNKKELKSMLPLIKRMADTLLIRSQQENSNLLIIPEEITRNKDSSVNSSAILRGFAIYDEAIKEFDILLKDYPLDITYMYEKGNCLSYLNKHKEALGVFKKAYTLSLSPLKDSSLAKAYLTFQTSDLPQTLLRISIAGTYEELNEIDSALVYHKLNIQDADDNTYRIGNDIAVQQFIEFVKRNGIKKEYSTVLSLLKNDKKDEMKDNIINYVLKVMSEDQ